MADEDKPAKTYGTPMGTEAPGNTARERPKVSESSAEVRKKMLSAAERSAGESKRPANATNTERDSSTMLGTSKFKDYDYRQSRQIDKDSG